VKIQTGSVVIAEAGRDSGGYFVVTGCDEKFCFIADGKSRKLSSPKRKNIKHIRLTDSMIDINGITDKKLRTMLRALCSE
jgi:ribosomal protein L14E/L6E/L27E